MSLFKNYKDNIYFKKIIKDFSVSSHSIEELRNDLKITFILKNKIEIIYSFRLSQFSCRADLKGFDNKAKTWKKFKIYSDLLNYVNTLSANIDTFKINNKRTKNYKKITKEQLLTRYKQFSLYLNSDGFSVSKSARLANISYDDAKAFLSGDLDIKPDDLI